MNALGIVNGIDLDAHWASVTRECKFFADKYGREGEEFYGTAWETMREAAKRFNPKRGAYRRFLSMLLHQRFVQQMRDEKSFGRQANGRLQKTAITLIDFEHLYDIPEISSKKEWDLEDMSRYCDKEQHRLMHLLYTDGLQKGVVAKKLRISSPTLQIRIDRLHRAVRKRVEDDR